jgi:hypothetical protein
MKVVINRCFGGFGLSPLAVKRMAELQGRACHFFAQDLSLGLCAPYEEKTMEEASDTIVWHAFDVPNPDEVVPNIDAREWAQMTLDERKAHNKKWESHRIADSDIERTDPLLIQVVEELGDKASGKLSKLRVVEIPDGVEWEIDEYDGMETIHEKPRTWGDQA